MYKRQLIATAARQSSLTQRQVRTALEATLETIAEALADGDHVVISGFGRFDLQTYPDRRLHRFDGPGHYRVEGRPVPAFRSSEALRRRVREEGS
jgi:integration host factor subunit beta